ncbi:MAG: polysaccharide biosynthesis/export family protein [Chitinophagaceae bacterium]|nr:polysaccharide biosynthesis/export family protein [Chitinophagaceae bacterium]
MKFIRILLLFSLPFYFFSCKPQQKIPYYLDRFSDTAGKGVVNIPELKIQKGDLLSIQVYSLSTKPEIDQLYNLPVTPGASAGTGQTAGAAGYLVDNNGNIEHHRLGIFHVEGMSKHELAAEVKKRLTQPVELLTNPTVIIRYLNFRVTVLGQVGREGPVTVPGERLTIFEALGLAGGITDYGKKDNVKILRETDGKREIGIVNLSSDSLFLSPYFNLVQNDVVLVEPTKQRMKDADQQRAFQKISMGLTLVAAAATLANIFIKN